MPRGESVVYPPSHCPHCRYSIPWYLNVPLITWLYLRGKCRNCGAPISSRYFFVELLTGITFLACWLIYGPFSAWVALAYCLLLAGFIAATFIDFEHFIIPDEITLGGIVAGFICSFLIPDLHAAKSVGEALKQSFLGILVGGGVVYAVLRGGKLLFGKQKIQVAADSTIVFTETHLVLPDESVPYEDLFYRNSDVILFHGQRIEMIDRCYVEADVRLTPKLLKIGDETFNPEQLPHLEARTSEVVIPREAMGFGDVKFMAAIGAFLGWPAALFSLMFSSVLGAAVGATLIVSGKRDWSSRIPYGPYIAAAATIWIFAWPIQKWWYWHIYNLSEMIRMSFGSR